MLPKKKRLTTEEFDRFFSSGRRLHSPHLTINFTPYQTFHGSVVVGKKVYKKAVARNKLRRQLYNTLYHQQQPNGVYIVIVKPTAKDTPIEILRSELVDQLKVIESAPKSR